MSMTSLMLAFLAPVMRTKPNDEGKRLRELEIENKALRDRLNDLTRINSALMRCESGQIAGLQAQLKTAAQRVEEYRHCLASYRAMYEGGQQAVQQAPLACQVSQASLDLMQAMRAQEAVRAFCTCTPSRSEMLMRAGMEEGPVGCWRMPDPIPSSAISRP
jgi:hypothetical protein